MSYKIIVDSCGELTEEKKERFRQEAGRQITGFFRDRGLI